MFIQPYKTAFGGRYEGREREYNRCVCNDLVKISHFIFVFTTFICIFAAVKQEYI